MTTKFSLLLPGVLAVMMAAVPVLPVFTEAATAAPVRLAGQRGGGMMQKLNLTDAQKAQMKTIRENQRAKMDALLTGEQKAELQKARQERRKPNLNLTESQKAQKQAIRQEAKTQMDALLTAEQKQQLEQLRQERRQNRPARNQGV